MLRMNATSPIMVSEGYLNGLMNGILGTTRRFSRVCALTADRPWIWHRLRV